MRNGQSFLRPATVKLLEEVERRGSLRSAAKVLHVSYQYAWDLIDEVNGVASEPVVVKQRGGVRGGGARLSARGRGLIDDFKHIERLVNRFAKKMNAEIGF